MKTIRFSLFAISMLLISSVANAQATRTWVSGVGDDVNPCSRTAPCKTWAGAISKTAKNGEINALDPGGFGTLTITKSITIDGAGTNASTLAALAPSGFLINITDPADTFKTVILRNLDINGATTGSNGVRILSANKVVIENCNIYGFRSASVGSGNGVTNENSLANSTLVIRNSSITHNSTFGIRGTGTGTGQQITVDDVLIAQNGSHGIDLIQNNKLSMSDSVVNHNGGSGVQLDAATTTADIRSSSMSFNTVGISAQGGAVGRIMTSQITGNAQSISGTVNSAGSNFVQGNTVQVLPTNIGGN